MIEFRINTLMLVTLTAEIHKVVLEMKNIMIDTFNGSQLAKLKKSILTCPCHEIYKDEAVGLKSCKYT